MFRRPAMTSEDKVKMFKLSHTTAHLFKIDNFSLLKKYGIEKVESTVFDLAGHNSKLHVYPNGIPKGNNHVSIFLENQDYSVNLKLKYELFILSHFEEKWHSSAIRDLWSTIETKGFAKFLSIADLNTKGYLIGDCAIFGFKIYGYEPCKPATGECFSLIEKLTNNKVTWMITKFSSLNPEKFHSSDEFVVGNRKWRIRVHPRGDQERKDKFFSVYLSGEGFINNVPEVKAFARYNLRVFDQVNRNHVELKVFSDWRDAGWGFWGFGSFMSLEKLNKPYLVKDKLYVGVEFEVISVTNYC